MSGAILHVDCNSFYVSCEMSENPSLCGKAVVVGGDVEARHGIVLAKSEKAKAAGIKTADTIGDAKRRCPNLIVLPPHYELYMKISREVRGILGDYSGHVEPFGIDETWVGLGTDTIRQGARLADEIRRRVREELGITASVGVADNKIMAKLGSDYKKPNATTVIAPEDYRSIVWPLPVGDLLGAGGATQTKLKRIGVFTIGDLAEMDPENLRHALGISGILLWQYANGLDRSPVARTGDVPDIESVSHSTTTPHDLCDVEQVRRTYWVLAEAVAARLRELRLRARTIQIQLRDNALYSLERQKKIRRPSNLAAEIIQTAMELFRANYDLSCQKPLRSVGVRCADVETEDGSVQLSMFENEGYRMRQEAVERAIDGIRGRFGPSAIRRASLIEDRAVAAHFRDVQTVQPFARR
jgi:DNA polymerase-4